MIKHSLRPDGCSAVLCIDEPLESSVLIALPHGSGIDDIWRLSDREVEDNQIAITNGYHLMDEGRYVAWIHFDVIYTLQRVHENVKDSWLIKKDIEFHESDIEALKQEFGEDGAMSLIAGLDGDIYERLDIAEEF